MKARKCVSRSPRCSWHAHPFQKRTHLVIQAVRIVGRAYHRQRHARRCPLSLFVPLNNGGQTRDQRRIPSVSHMHDSERWTAAVAAPLAPATEARAARPPRRRDYLFAGDHRALDVRITARLNRQRIACGDMRMGPFNRIAISMASASRHARRERDIVLRAAQSNRYANAGTTAAIRRMLAARALRRLRIDRPLCQQRRDIVR
jgi:hypothetical protein